MGDETVKVVVRCRPPNEKEKREGRGECIKVHVAENQVAITNPDTAAGSAPDVKTFTFDAVYDATSIQRSVYEETAFALVESVLQGFNGTIFAYGQTGSGKTWSMQGLPSPPDLRGITPNSFDHVFEYIKQAADKDFLVRCTFLELYNEEIRDLLAPVDKKLDLRENADGVYVQDLTYMVVDTAAKLEDILNEGNKRRTVGATAMNAQSSRSHSIFTVIVEASENRDGRDCITRGKLNLVDLAGSERLDKTGATGTRMKEGIKINLSLTVLGNVIQALADGKAKHIPYRDSKLTRLLSDSLGGNTRTVMLAAINSADYNYEETLSTLRYANRAKNIKNKPVINEDPKDALLRQYKDEIEQLKALLAQHLSGASLPPDRVAALFGGSLPSAAAGAAKPAPALMPPPAAAETPSPAPAAAAVVQAESVATPQAAAAVGVVDDVPVDAAPAASVVSSAPDTLTAPPPVAAPIADASDVPQTADAGSTAVPPTTVSPTSSMDAEALEAARREAEAERKTREELANKLLALQHMLVASGVKTGGKKKGSRRASQQGLPDAAPAESAAADDAAGSPVALSEAELDPEVILARQQHEHRRAQMKLRAQKRREAKMREEQAALADEKAAVEEDMRLLSENVAALESDLSTKERIMRKLRGKYNAKVDAVKREMAEAAEEWRSTRESLMTTVREQAREMKLLEQVVLVFLTQRELGRVWERAEYDEELERWNLPQIRPKQGWRARSTGSTYATLDEDEGVVIDDSGMPPLGGVGVYRGASSEGGRLGSAGVPNGGLPSLGGPSSRAGTRAPSQLGGRTNDSGPLPVLTNPSSRQSTPASRSDTNGSLSGPLPVVGTTRSSARTSVSRAASPVDDGRSPPAALPGIAASGQRNRPYTNSQVSQDPTVLPAVGGRDAKQRGDWQSVPVSDLPDVNGAGALPAIGDTSSSPTFDLSPSPTAATSTPALPTIGPNGLQPVAPPRERVPSRSGSRRPGRPAAGRGPASNTPTAFPSIAANGPVSPTNDEAYPDDFVESESPRKDASAAPALPGISAAPRNAGTSSITPRTAAASSTPLPTVGGGAPKKPAASGAAKSSAPASNAASGGLPTIGGGARAAGAAASGAKGKPAATATRSTALPSI